ncbi:MAG: ABC transporter permease [Lentisphaerae bacterium]|nr:ABC transporter permease [Lentisphaerota bacterium]
MHVQCSGETVWSAILRQRQLLRQLVRHNVLERYRGALLGLLWSLLTPLAMLAVYSFVFGFVLKVEWKESPPGVGSFALTLFAGLIAYNFFSEVVNQSTTVIIRNPNYVKKVLFPLEILPVAKLGEGLYHTAASFLILLVGELVLLHRIPMTALCLPVVLLPLILFTAGMAWFLAALGVFVRDAPYVVGIATNVLFFATPILYPASSLPPSFRWLVYMNPLAGSVHHCRQLLIWGEWPNVAWFCYTLIVAIVTFYLGFIFFSKTQRSFADVL